MAETLVSSGLPPDVTRTAVTVGSFDGVHRGHQDVLRQLVERARALAVHSVLVTFDPHPLQIVNPSAAPQLLTVGDEKLEVLAESGIDFVAVLPFNPALASWSAERFVSDILLSRFRMHDLLMGHDHRFGHNRSGDVETMRRLGAERGFDVSVVPAVTVNGGQSVSSTAIRRAVAGGDLDGAFRGLGRHYSISGRVGEGARRGRLLGFPTANVPVPSSKKLLPPEGVYAVRVQTPMGPHDGMLNLGPRPTFGDTEVVLEAHLFDADLDLYGAPVRIDFVGRLRDTQKFSGVEALVEQLNVDATNARRLLARG
ncbi:MAG TPA: bifunctional riboflavin kinase/FAD synthetase [Gemmatimonadaceae bacterium]|nr:bifunctional riboflavin kinase/FAD synthetase [Gemmatimonadaceae bacterium]